VSVVRIEYRRPPDRTDWFEQDAVAVEDGCHVTLLQHTQLDQAKLIGEQPVLENGSAIVWFTFEGAWHDIGRFHLADGTFTGWYANAIRPVTFRDPHSWECTDLFLDVWLGPDGEPRVLDAADLDHAVEQGWVSHEDAQRARIEVDHILAAAAIGAWPPRVAREWTLDRARATLNI
jgi:predicted RNA-binding protein associated with RNAse of E/G family